jgi:L-malate glycosyltransferase
MRISLLAPANSVHIVQWASVLRSRGHELQLISLHRPVDARAFDHLAQLVELRGHGSLGYVTAAPAARRAIDQFDPDVVHAHYASGYGTLGRLVRRHPYVVSVWGSDVYEFPARRLQRHLVVGNLRAADAVTSTSFVMQHRTNELVGTDIEVTVVPFGVDTDAFAPRTHQSSTEERLRVGTVKSLSPKYGVDDLLRAVAALPVDLRSRTTLEIFGDGPQRDELLRTAGCLSLDNATFHGSVPHSQVPDHLRTLDVYVALSVADSESFGVAVIEASACGLPVVVSDVGGLPEVVADGVTGFIVPRRDPGRAAERIAELLVDPRLRSALGAAGRQLVLNHYTWPKCAAAMESVYESLIGATRA